MSGLYNIMDAEVAGQLKVSVETYIDIIENKCNQEERDFIILTILEENEKEMPMAKYIFNSYLHE
jgi:hypothetical protein|tara:strand:- start:348 stop:542 length:195 start_codon:yes stop_codon:yes gene_type:complete